MGLIMIKFIVKLTFIISLCIGISVSSYAAVSVSDGSAFVTKAELSADLNNLSNRMAQLENSVDSKIDSLVSSYLSKNGIWNAASQELTSIVKNEYAFQPNFIAGNRGTKYEEKVRFADAIVEQTNKSGMAFGSFSYGNQHKGNANYWYYGVYNTNSVGSAWAWDQNLCITLSFYETASSVSSLNFDSSGNITNGELKSVVEIGKTLAFTNWGDYTLIAIPVPNWNITPFVFFVEKDKKIWWRWKEELSTYNLTNVVNTARSDLEQGGAMRVLLNELSIY